MVMKHLISAQVQYRNPYTVYCVLVRRSSWLEHQKLAALLLKATPIGLTSEL
jgi:hypothetical protein